MRIVITGSKGYLGKNITDYFKSKNHEVIEYDLKENGRDYLNLIYDSELNKTDVIIHLAAVGNVADEYKVELVLQNNVNNLSKLCQYLKNIKWEGRFIFFSSAMVYADNVGVYGASKIIGESIVKKFLNNWNIIRPFNTIGGKFLDTENNRILLQITDCIKNKKPFVLFNKGQTERYYIHIDNLFPVIEESTTGRKKRIIVVRSDKTRKITDLLKMSEIISNSKIDLVDGGRLEWIVKELKVKDDVEEVVSDTDKDLEKAIKEYLVCTKNH